MASLTFENAKAIHEMPRERLVCVWQAAYCLEARSGADLSISSCPKQEVVRELLRNISINSSSRTLADEIHSIENQGLGLEKIKDSISVYLHQMDDDKREDFLNTVERACWKMSASSFNSRALNEPEMEKLWWIFNRMAEPGSYPPTASIESLQWLFKRIAIETGRTWNESFPIPVRRLNLQEMIDQLDGSFFEITNTSTVRQCVHKLYELLVRQVLKAGWLFKRKKRNNSFTNTVRRWVVMTPGFVVYYENRDSKTRKGELALKYACSVKNGPVSTGRKSFFNNHKLRYIFTLETNLSTFYEFGAESAHEKEDWLQMLTLNIDATKHGVIPVTYKYQNMKRCSDLETRAENPPPSQLPANQPQPGWTPPGTPPVTPPGTPSSDSHPNLQEGTDHSEDDESEEDEDFKVLFQQIDTDRNGKIDKFEFFEFIKLFGICVSSEVTDAIFASLEKQGFIVYHDFYHFFVSLAMGETSQNVAEIRLRAAFLKADTTGNGKLNFREFAEYALSVRRSYTVSMLLRAFEEIEDDDTAEIQFDDFKNFFDTLREEQPNPESEGYLENYLKSFCHQDHDAREMADYVKSRVSKFKSQLSLPSSLKTVRISSSLTPQYELLEIVCFNDHNKTCNPSSLMVKAEDSSGQLVLSSISDIAVPKEKATKNKLSLYGGNLVDEQQLKFAQLYRLRIVDYTRAKPVIIRSSDSPQVKLTEGLERHNVPHLLRPLEENSGFVLIGKYEDSNLFLTAYFVATGKTLFLPSGLLHSKENMTGAWRTMCTEHAHIDTVFLAERIVEKQSVSCGRITELSLDV